MRFNSLLNLFFPRNCIFCNKKGYNVCEDCINKRLIKTGHTCHVCGNKISNVLRFVHSDCAKYSMLDGVFSCYQYNKEAKEILRLIKYDGYYDIVKDVVRSMQDRFSNLPVAYDFLVPVPIHRNKLRDRGFNQAELIAKGLTWNYNNILVRVRNTKAQAGLDKSERIVNVENAFEVAGGADVKGKTILLIDDVLTTGSTLENCAAALKQNKAVKVYGFTWARD